MPLIEFSRGVKFRATAGPRGQVVVSEITNGLDPIYKTRTFVGGKHKAGEALAREESFFTNSKDVIGATSRALALLTAAAVIKGVRERSFGKAFTRALVGLSIAIELGIVGKLLDVAAQNSRKQADSVEDML